MHVARALLLMGTVWIGTLRAQDPLAALPRNYRLVFENESVRVIRTQYGPHEKLPVHDHSRRPTVYVYLSDSPPVRFGHEEEKPFDLVRAAVRKGAFRVSPGRLEVHTVENLGGAPSDFLRVELKKVPLGIRDFAFRGNQPFDLSAGGTAVVYSRPHLAIDRIICAANSLCAIRKTAAPSLLVALSPAVLDGQRLDEGAVCWLPKSQSRAAQSPAHFLRLSLLP